MRSIAPIVRELADLLTADPGLRRQLEEALRDRDARPEDIWGEMTLEGLFEFFDAWYNGPPAIDRENCHLHDFLQLHRTAKGLALVKDTDFGQWLNRFARARGELLDSEASRWMISRWTGHPAIDLSDFEVPAAGYLSFNEFFTRRLKPGVRPIASPEDDRVIVSPADSELQAPLALDPQSPVEVKGMLLSLSDLLGKTAFAEPFRNGTASVHFLGVKDYHRFHAPFAAKIVQDTRISGLCFGCDDYPGEFFTEHPRGFFILDTGKYGLVGMVTVGIATVSSIRLQRFTGEVVSKGEELGHFAYGGSAILLLFQEGQVQLEGSPRQHVLMGSRLGSFTGRS